MNFLFVPLRAFLECVFVCFVIDIKNEFLNLYDILFPNYFCCFFAFILNFKLFLIEKFMTFNNETTGQTAERSDTCVNFLRDVRNLGVRPFI